jgi:carbamoyl-phosphate synthase large subunit
MQSAKRRSYRVLVAGAGSPGGVNLTRSVRAAGHFTLGTDCRRYYIHLSEADVRARIPHSAKGRAYLDALNRLIREHAIDVVVPSNGTEVRALSRARDRVEAGVLLPSPETVDICQSKWRTFSVLKEGGVPVPETRLIDSFSDLKQTFDAIETRPVWVRGAGIPGRGVGVASLPCSDLDVARAWIEHFDGWGKFVASEFLPGSNLTWMGVFRHGELFRSQTRERLEYVIPHVSPSGITGAPAVSRTVDRPEAAATGEAAVRTVDERVDGVLFVDMKGDSADRPRVTEINGGRFGTTNHFYTRAGANFPDVLIRLAMGEDVSPRREPLEPNLYWIRTLDCGPVLLSEADLDQGFEDLTS